MPGMKKKKQQELFGPISILHSMYQQKTKYMDSGDLGKLLRGSERNLAPFLGKKKKKEV